VPNWGSNYTYYIKKDRISRPFYKTSPLYLIIKNKKSDILTNLLHVFNNMFDFRLNIGIEIEFYITSNKKFNTLYEIQKILPPNYIAENEQGYQQFEIKTRTYTNIPKLISDYKTTMLAVQKLCHDNELTFDISAIPLPNDCGSALQINLSLLDINGKNLFARSQQIDTSPEDNKLLLHCVAGLLKNINNNLLLYINNASCLERFDLERNKNIFASKKYPAPTFVSWGINNRSAAVRIPTPKTSNIKDYREEDNLGRRIEFRVPSSSADIELVLIGVITSIMEGINHVLWPPTKTSYNVFEKNDGMEHIVKDFYVLNDIFEIRDDVLFF